MKCKRNRKKARNATKKKEEKASTSYVIRKDFIFYCLMCFFVFDKKRARKRERESKRAKARNEIHCVRKFRIN